MRRRLIIGTVAGLVAWWAVTPQPVAQVNAQASGVTALVGGTLIDGFGGTPIQNSVILVRGERITAVGTVGTLVNRTGFLGGLIP